MKQQILLVSGSAQQESVNERYLAVFDRLITKDPGYQTKTVRLRTLELPLFLGYVTSRSQAVGKWRTAVEEADGLVLATPEYDHALPAVLKNAFEHLDGSKGLENKPVLLFGASTGQFGTLQAQHSIYPILRTYKAWLLPPELYIARADKIIDGNDQVTDERVRQRITELTALFLRSVTVLRQLRD